MPLDLLGVYIGPGSLFDLHQTYLHSLYTILSGMQVGVVGISAQRV